MGYQVYEDIPARDYGVRRWAGYGVPAICDFAECEAEIDRGMGYRCEEYTRYTYFDEHSNPCAVTDDWDDEREEQVVGCQLHFCEEHSEHSTHKGSIPKPDTAEWVAWMLADESWTEWRSDNPSMVAALQQVTR
jgi:hypothetical protein